MGRPNKGSSLTEKAFDNYSSSDYLAGFENGGSTHKYNIGNVSKYALEKQTLSAGGKSGTVKSIIDSITPRVKKNEDDIVELSGDITAKGAALTELSGRVNAMESGPLVAATSSAMVDTTRIYVYTGEELGMTAGNWYYHNGTAWVSGGVYNAVAVNTDDTLSVEDVPADAKAVGDALEDMDEQKANVDGVYESMTVGNAEQLIGSVFTEDSTPYNFRTSGGAIDIGDRLYDKLVGGTVAWNQRSQSNRPQTTFYGMTATLENGVLTLSGTYDGGELSAFRVGTSGEEIPYGHKVLFAIDSNKFIARLQGEMSVYGSTAIYNVIGDGVLFDIVLGNNGASGYASGDTVNETLHPQVFDLTQMFGSAIADYIYSLEQSTAGAGVAFFRKLFPKPYYPYNAGELMSVQTSAHVTRGFNAWDEEWEVGRINVNTGENVSSSNVRSKNFIPILPNTDYYIESPIKQWYCPMTFYDKNKNFIGSYTQLLWGKTITTPANAAYAKFYMHADYGTYYNNDICINLSWDGERDGEYEEYKEHVYPLDSNLTLRGIPKLDANNKLYYDGDTYESDGTVKRKYGIVDLGDFTWFATTANGYPVFYCASSNSGTPYRAFNILCSKYSDTSALGAADKTISGYGITSGSSQYSRIGIRDDSCSEMTGSEFRTAVTGVYALVELAEPTEETAAPYQNPQVVDDFGTEEYVDSRTVQIPVGHETKYANNLRAKLEMAPDSPDGNGDYIVRHTNGENEYTPLVIPKELPNTPSEDGIYHLKVTVVNGAAGLSWESEA